MMFKPGCMVLLVFASLGAQATQAPLRAALAVEQARDAVPLLPRAAFLIRPAIETVSLAPDGEQLAYIQVIHEDRVVVLAPTSGGPERRVQIHSTAQLLRWSRDGHWLLLGSPTAVYAVPVGAPGEARIIAALDDEYSLLSVDPGSDAGILLLQHTRSAADGTRRSRLLRVDMRGARSVLYEDPRPITDAAFDRNGSLMYLTRVEPDDSNAILATTARGAPRPVARCEMLERCTLLPRVADNGDLLLKADVGGGLYRWQRMTKDGALHTEHVDPRAEADLDQLVLEPATGRPLFASYRSTIAATYGLNDAMQQQLAILQRKLPDHDLHLQVSAGQWLIEERASTLQVSRWHLYDPQTHSLREILRLSEAATLAPSLLARKVALSYTASDGMRLHGFLTLPPGAKPDRAPLLALVHGGPWNHVRPGYDNFTQFLANRGYAVFEPDFRGSTGLGRNYLLAARGDYGNGRVQQDVVEGVEYLLASGIGDAARVGIVGASFGGYSTLLGVTFRPDLFRVGVAFVPPSDFAVALRWISRSTEALELAEHVPLGSLLRMLSLDPADATVMQRLRAQAPLTHVARMQRPLLLIAGGADRRVAISSVVEYAARLKVLGRDVSLLVDPDAGHSIREPLAREAHLYLLETTLAKHLGSKPAAVPHRELREYLDRHLRIRGPSLEGFR